MKEVEIRYEKTSDPNIIKMIRIIEEEVYLDKLEGRINLLKRRLVETEARWYEEKIIQYEKLLRKLEKL